MNKSRATLRIIQNNSPARCLVGTAIKFYANYTPKILMSSPLKISPIFGTDNIPRK